MRKLCDECGHWFIGTRQRWDLPAGIMGNCTVNPVWQETSPSHFCGQWRGNTDETPGHANSRRLDLETAAERADREQKRAIAAEKALKVARQQIRTLKAMRERL